jgi:DNA adenine methylase
MVDAGVPLKKQGEGIEEDKKILQPIFCRVGNKTTLIDDILKVIPQHTTYVEPFVGGASIFWNKSKAKQNVLNDLDSELINGYKALKKASINPKDYPVIDDKDVNVRLKKLNEFVNKNHTNPNSIVLSLMYNSCNTFSSKGIGKIYKGRSLQSKVNNIEFFVKKLKQNVILTNQDYKSILKKYDKPSTFFFLDPPYEKSKGLYKKSYIDYVEMESILKKLKGKFLLTINDSPEIRKIFSGFNIYPIKVSSQSKGSYSFKGSRNELFITNYNMKQGGSVETDNFNDKEIVSIPEFKSVKMTLPTYMYKRLPDIDGKPPLYKYKLVIPITSSRNISSRKAEKSIVINQKPVAKAIVSINKNKEKPTLDDFSPEDQDKLTEYYDKVEENENKSPDEIQNDSYKIVPRGKPLPCPNVKKSKKEKPVKEKVVKEKGVKGRPKNPKKEIVLGNREETISIEPPEEKEEDTLDKEDEDLLLNNYEEFKKKYGLESKSGKGLENIVSTDNIKMPNKWIEYVKSYASKHNMSYRDALRDSKCKAGYKKVGGAVVKKGAGFMEDKIREIVRVDDRIPAVAKERVIDIAIRKTHFNQPNPISVPREAVNLAFADFIIRGRGIVDELGNQDLIAEKYNGSQLGANAGRKFISL